MKVPGDSHAFHNAIKWLREYKNIPLNQTVCNDFEQYFNCKVIEKNTDNFFWQVDYIQFNNESDSTMFLLRWS